MIWTIDRLGFESRDAAVQIISQTSNAEIVAAATDLYATGNELIVLGSRTILLARDFIDVANGVTKVRRSTEKVVGAVNDAFAFAAQTTQLLDDLNSLFQSLQRAADSTAIALRRQAPTPAVSAHSEATVNAARAFFRAALSILSTGQTSQLVIQ